MDPSTEFQLMRLLRCEPVGAAQPDEGKAVDALWKTLTAADVAMTAASCTMYPIPEGLSTLPTAPTLTTTGAGPKVPLAIEIGKITVSEQERWQLQAALRRQAVGGGQQYNRKLMRPQKIVKAPTPGEGWPAGRGRPTS
jgi:hypothetical protein